MDDIAVLPDDVEQLKRIVSQLQGRLKTAEIEIAYEQEKYQALVRQIFGTKSEKRSREDKKQFRLFNEAEHVSESPKSDDKPMIPVKGHKKRKGGGRKPLPSDLERKRIIHELSEEDRVCTCCGEDRPVIGEESSEELETIPQQYLVHVHVRLKYGPCSCDEFQELDTPPVVTAPMPKRLIPGSQFSSNCIAFFVTAKFVDSIPFYRMEKVLARSGIDIPRITLCQNAISAASACQPLIDALWEKTLQCPVIQMDETTLQVLKEPNRPATSKSYMWVTVGIDEGKKIVLYHYHSSRKGEIAVQALDGYCGYLQTDGYSGYNEVGSVEGVRHVSDFVHIRRQFERADQASKGNGEAQKALEYIGELYRIEKELRAKDLSEERFVSERKRLTLEPLETMYRWMIDTSPAIPPKTLLGKAFTYAMGQWEKAIRYLEHPLMTPDTNIVENAIRPYVVGRKNWLFAATPRGAHASAALYSLVETAKAHGLEPYRYFCYIFRKVPEAETDADYQALLPHNLTPEDLIEPG